MKLRSKILKDISIRLKLRNSESKKKSLKVLMRLGMISYLKTLNNFSKTHERLGFHLHKNRCFITSRPSGNYSKLSLSRLKLRELVHNRLIVGFVKASW